MHARLTAENLLETAIDAVHGGDGFQHVLDALPVPIYLTDADGLVTYWNRACVEFAGREPELGKDKWCVTWRIHTTSDDLLPHEKCPMADAIRQKQKIRGKVAIAVRPDGSRRAFTPYPTPLFDEAGNMTGAVNMLIDVSDAQVPELVDQAARCRRIARATHDSEARRMLLSMAAGYQINAAALQSAD